MGIIDTGEIYALSVTFDYLTFIEQHSDAHLLKTGQHSDRVVISQYPINRSLQRSTNTRHARHGRVIWAKSLASVVSGQDAEIVIDFSQNNLDTLHSGLARIDMEV